MSILESIIDLLDGWVNASALVAEPAGYAIAGALERTLQGVQLPATRAATEAFLRSLPPLSNGEAKPESSGTWTHWPSPGARGPTLGVVDVCQLEPRFSSAAAMVESLSVTDEATWNATGCVDTVDSPISWIVGVATGPADPQHVLVLGSGGPMAYVILASSESELERVLGAVSSSLPGAHR
jgi:hypothetical protein